MKLKFKREEHNHKLHLKQGPYFDGEGVMAELNKHAGISVGVAIVVGLLTLACTREPTAEQKATDRAKLTEAREKLEQQAAQMVKATGQIAEPLKNLKEEQIASVVALSYLTRSLALANSPNVRMPGAIGSQFKDKLGSISPNLARVATTKSIVFACFDQSISCLSALKKCEDEGTDESKCFESWGPCAEEIYCVMGQLEAMKGRINVIFGGLRPPRPIPWPE